MPKPDKNSNVPREFWIDVDYENLVTGEVEGRALSKRELTDTIHVIEYSAYAQLMEAAEEMAVALKTMAKGEGQMNPSKICMNRLARKTLEKFEAFKKAGGK